MKSVKPILIALAVLAALGTGCSTLSPSASRIPPPYPDQVNAPDQRYPDGLGDIALMIAYWTIYCAGEVLSCR